MALDERLVAKDKEDVSSSQKNRAIQGRHDGNGASGDRFTHYAGYTRLSRIEFPRFNGDNVKEWLYQCETYFLMDETPPEVKTNWEEYVQILTERFGDACDDPMAELMNLRQKGTISEYHEQFDAIMTRLDLPANYSLSCFLGGLKIEVQMMVRMFQPSQ
ncbi:uncharacterized protein LOC114374741 [Glycine soja]|uniref:uncharacterized protein n=1 Tax=Glycine max TaxID=3847 RepID=UPI0003DE98E4|nr:uncharacterized protein LOC102669111 [Glycine max]XP_028188213.1 uncharacterized protein LOC114374741 [Glycine soja]|eukprot:XP_006575964.1 uncharacterized protein LOC102669111 [Glycine max]